MDMEYLLLETGANGADLDNFEMPGFFVFDFRIPEGSEFEGREYGVTYNYTGGRKLSPASYVLEKILKWRDPGMTEPDCDGIPVRLEEVNASLSATGYTVHDIFVHLLEKNKVRKSSVQ